MIVRPRYRGPEIPTTYAVDMTSGAGTGIVVADGVEVNPGTGNFTAELRGSLPSYASGAATFLMLKYENDNNRWAFLVEVYGNLKVFAVVGGVVVFDITSTAQLALSANESATIAVSVIRESPDSAGSVIFTVNGVQLGSAVAITAASTVSLDNTGPLYINGTASVRNDSITRSFTLLNFAPTDSEILDWYVSGMPEAWQYGSNVPTYTSDFTAGLDGWIQEGITALSGNVDGIGGQDDWLEIEATAAGGVGTRKEGIGGAADTIIRLSALVYLPSSNTVATGVKFIFYTAGVGTVFEQSQQLTDDTVTEIVIDSSVLARVVNRIYIVLINAVGAELAALGDILYVKNINTYRLGATAHLAPNGIATGSGLTWQGSANGVDGTLPASGATKVSIRK